MLKRNQLPRLLNDMVKANYYHYLKSDAFKEAFLCPLGDFVNDLGGTCLDVGCGEGWLKEFIKVPYMGFDGSEEAIKKAKDRFPGTPFTVDRFESFPDSHKGKFSTIIFGNILDVLVKRDYHLELIKKYMEFKPSYFIVYDLQRMNTTHIQNTYTMTRQHIDYAEYDGIEEVKKHRKIEVYRC